MTYLAGVLSSSFSIIFFVFIIAALGYLIGAAMINTKKIIEKEEERTPAKYVMLYYDLRITLLRTSDCRGCSEAGA